MEYDWNINIRALINIIRINYIDKKIINRINYHVVACFRIGQAWGPLCVGQEGGNQDH